MKQTKTITTEMFAAYKNDYDRGLNDKLSCVTYRKLQNTRRAGIVVNYTSEEFMKIIQIHSEPRSFPQYLGLSLRGYQENILHNYFAHKFFFVYASRQTGISMMLHIIALYEAVVKGKTVRLIVRNNSIRINMMQHIQEMYCKLPFYIQAGIIAMNTQDMQFENGGRIAISTRVCIGYNAETTLIDTVSDSNLEELMNSLYPCISALVNARLLIASTGGCGAVANKLIDGALRFNGDPKKNGFVIQKVGYWEVPGRDTNWVKEQIKMLGSEEKFNTEFDIH